MHKLEAIKVLEAKLAAIEQEHHAEFASDEDMRDQTDAFAALAVHCSSYMMAVRYLRSTTAARTWDFLCSVGRSKTAS
jgi:hypothetical protein